MTRKEAADILQIEPSSDEALIRKAYRKMAMKYHPDLNNSPSAETQFMQIHQAYLVLLHLQNETLDLSSIPSDQEYKKYQNVYQAPTDPREYALWRKAAMERWEREKKNYSPRTVDNGFSKRNILYLALVLLSFISVVSYMYLSTSTKTTRLFDTLLFTSCGIGAYFLLRQKMKQLYHDWARASFIIGFASIAPFTSMSIYLLNNHTRIQSWEERYKIIHTARHPSKPKMQIVYLDNYALFEYENLREIQGSSGEYVHYHFKKGIFFITYLDHYTIQKHN